jgi:hypothetical protein
MENIGETLKRLHKMPHYRLFEVNNELRGAALEDRKKISDKKTDLIIECIKDGRYETIINDSIDPVSIKINLHGITVGAVHLPMPIYNLSKIKKLKNVFI